MKQIIRIPDKEGCLHLFYFNFYQAKRTIRYEVDNVCIIDVWKAHDHRYDLKAFFYDKKYITYEKNIRSKKELYSAIQNLLKQNLYQAVQ